MEAVLVLLPVFATAKSGFPSKLKSPMLRSLGKLPVGKSTLVAKVGVVALVAVVLSRMEAVLLPVFATAKSGFPSKLKSPMLRSLGKLPVGKSTLVAKVGVVALVAVVLSRMEAVLLSAFATAKSGFPSKLMSPMLTDLGKLPVGKSTLVAKVGVVALVAVVLSRMEAVLLSAFATAKSGFPSKLMSPMLTDLGKLPVGKSTLVAKVGVVALVAVVLSRMEAVLLSAFATAKSGFPSKLMSPMLTDLGKLPVGKSTLVAKVGVVALVAVVLSRMEAVLLSAFATAKSGFPSKLMSPMLTDLGKLPVGKSTLVAKVGVVALVAVVLSRMEAVLLSAFATAKSGFPSKLMSPMLTDLGKLPVGKSTLVAKVGVVALVAVVLSRMEAVLLSAFATAKSGFPSKLMSPMLTDLGKLPVGKSTLVAKVGVVALVAVVLSRMEAVLLSAFATAKSGFPSKLMSPMLTDLGKLPVGKSTLVAKVGVVALVAVVLSRMEAVLLSAFATAKSGFPSKLMSPMLTDKGKLPVGKSTLVAKVGVVALVAVVLSRMEAVLLSAFATAKSGFPSKLMSPMLTDLGKLPVGKSTLVAKVGVVALVAVVLSR